LAFENTFPVVAWTLQRSTALELLPSTVSDSGGLVHSILSAEGICNHDAVVIIEQPGLHASDLRSLPSSCHLAKNLASAPSCRQYPYSQSSGDVPSAVEALVAKCNSRIITLTPGGELHGFDKQSKHVVRATFPKLDGSGKDRRKVMESHESLLSGFVAQLSSKFPDLLFIYTGQPSSAHLGKRQSPGSPSVNRPVLSLISSNSALPEGGILKRYQLLTPGVITALLVSFFILGVIMVGLRALASIQSPVRVEAPKDYSATTKKNQ